MNKLVLTLLMTLLLFVSAAPVQAAPAPAPVTQPLAVPEQLAYVDAMVEVFAGKLSEYQMQYYAAHGVYFQALPSNTVPPEVLEAPDGLLGSPTDQSTPLAALWVYAGLPMELSWSFRVDTYNGEDGPGYVLEIGTSIEGDVYLRALNVGPETYRARDWYKVVPEE